MRGWKEEGEARINGAALPILEGQIGCLAWRERSPAKAFDDRRYADSAHPHNANRAAPGGGGDGGYRIS
jgi:hypothetical protein